MIDSAARATEPRSVDRSAVRDDPRWTAFVKTYASSLIEAQRGRLEDPVSECVVQLLRALAPGPSLPTGTRRPAQLERRARIRAAQIVTAFAAEPGGLVGCLKRAAHSGGFEWFRDRLERNRFSRVVSWKLCLALRRARMLSAQPNRPYLDRRGVRLAQELLEGTGVRAHTVRDWEAALMLEADSRLSRGATPTRLDAEIVTLVCARLSHGNDGAVPFPHP